MVPLQDKHQNSKIIHRLTALWALSESGLGGIMHALKIPFTGFILGGFAVIIVSLIAHFSNNNFRKILQVTGLVVLIKAGVSPQSPLPAYVAVGFQGLAGALFFSLIRNYRIAAVAFGFIALLESAVQQLLIATILFGKSIWVAIDLFVRGVLNDFQLVPGFSFSTGLVLFYLIAYSVWGIYLGFYAGKLPLRLQETSSEIESRFRSMHQLSVDPLATAKHTKSKFISLLAVLIFVAAVFYLEGDFSKVYAVILRTVAIVLFVFLILRPVISFLFQKATKGKEAELNKIMLQLPEIGSLVRPALLLASEQKRGPAKYREFVFVLIVLSLMGHNNHH